MITCSQCKKEHEGPFKHCDGCRAYHREWKQAHAARLNEEARLYREKYPDKVKESKAKYRATEKGKRKQHDHNLRKAYGITLADKEQMYNEQKGLCALCEKDLPPVIQSHYEHNHETGKGRGLVHKRCNDFIGLVESIPEVLNKIGPYLER